VETESQEGSRVELGMNQRAGRMVAKYAGSMRCAATKIASQRDLGTGYAAASYDKQRARCILG
jgi:hypothetical protein